ncbi:MAG: hypothetical protein ABIH46_00535 [Chloroflexota bacterium]
MTDEEQRVEPESPDEVLTAKEARISELETSVAEMKASLVEQAQGLAAQGEVLQAAQEEAEALKERLAQATAKFREALLAQAPEVPHELVTGESIEEIETTLASGKALVEQVKRQLESTVSAGRVPAGAPARSGPDLSTLSPREKITYALSRA